MSNTPVGLGNATVFAGHIRNLTKGTEKSATSYWIDIAVKQEVAEVKLGASIIVDGELVLNFINSAKNHRADKVYLTTTGDLVAHFNLNA